MNKEFFNSAMMFALTCLVSIGVYIFAGFDGTLKEMQGSINSLNHNVSVLITQKKYTDKELEELSQVDKEIIVRIRRLERELKSAN